MKTRLMIVVAVAAVAVACHDGGEGPGGGPEELRLTGAIKGEVVARGAVAGEVIAAGEVVHAWVDEAVNPAVAHVKAWRLEADGNGGLNGAACYFPENGNDVNIYAMHGNFNYVIEEGVTGFPSWIMECEVERMQAGEVGAANRAKSDLLFAIERGVSRGRESDGVTTRELTFYHLLSKVEVALKASDEVGDLTGAVVSVGGTFNRGYFMPDKEAVMEDAAERGKMIAPDGSSDGPITIDTRVTGNFDGNTEYGEAIAVPGTGLFIRVDLKDGKVLFYHSKVKLESGKKYRYNIYVGKERLELVSTSISAWETGTSDGGEAGMMRQVDLSGGEYTIADDGVYCVSGESKYYSLIIKGSPTVYLVDATIEGWYVSPIQVSSGNPVIVLVGTNRLTGRGYYSGLYYKPGCKVTLRGEGKLIAESMGGTGIGSYMDHSAGDLVIESGTIEATGGLGDPGNAGNAGIGGSSNAGCGSITITGGKVTARGSDGAAAIGAGKNGPCSSIVLENCEIHVPGDGKGGLSGANGIVAGSVVPDLSDGEEMREKGVRVEGI